MSKTDWERKQFIDAGARFRDRWAAAGTALNLELHGFRDIVSVVDNNFSLSESDLAKIMLLTDGQHCITASMDQRFKQSEKTKMLDSPYEALLEIIENGGSFSIEHGIIDIRDSSSVAVGGFMLRHSGFNGNQS